MKGLTSLCGVVIFVITLCSGCGSTRDEYQSMDWQSERLIEVEHFAPHGLIGYHVVIVRDTDTGREYLLYEDGYGVAICPVLGPSERIKE